MQISGNTILVTGGNSGIGHRLAEEFAARGNRVIITGRRQDAIDAVVAANENIVAGYVLDMQHAGAIAAFGARVTADHPDLNVVVNNAGIMVAEDVKALDLDIAEATVTTNLLGPIRLTAAILPHFLARPTATIVTVSSGLAFVPLAATPTYCATKAAIHSWSISLRHQLRDTSVEVIEVIPPSVQTDLMPGHADDPQAMPLEDYIAETMANFEQPGLTENKVARLAFLRDAEAEGRFDQTFAKLNAEHR
ncbi:SDR family oxidoreductase [Sphingomonas sp.]|uniref:SDR family oxidoreductase n=1 Tax=Sphingomonas sp. TaxID=28214 RepID=UPI003B3AF87B